VIAHPRVPKKKKKKLRHSQPIKSFELRLIFSEKGNYHGAELVLCRNEGTLCSGTGRDTYSWDFVRQTAAVQQFEIQKVTYCIKSQHSVQQNTLYCPQIFYITISR
jgi:hypothetical protein